MDECSSQVVKLFPNPASSIVTIKASKSICQIEVFDLFYICQLNLNVGYLKEISVELSSLQKGAYFIKVYSNKMDFTIHKLMKN